MANDGERVFDSFIEEKVMLEQLKFPKEIAKAVGLRNCLREESIDPFRR